MSEMLLEYAKKKCLGLPIYSIELKDGGSSFVCLVSLDGRTSNSGDCPQSLISTCRDSAALNWIRDNYVRVRDNPDDPALPIQVPQESVDKAWIMKF
jgi:hypothetical protein